MTTHARPVVRIKRYAAASALGRAYLVHNGMASDPGRFPAPNPPLDVLQGQIDKVQDATKQAKLRIAGATQVRDLEASRLIGMLQSECLYVKALCDASPEEADVIIKASGFAAAAPRLYAKPLLDVAYGNTSGSVVLRAAVSALTGGASKRRVFHWQWTDDGGQTFHDARPTALGKIVISDLPPRTTIGFRASVTMGEVTGEWTPVVSILVH